MAERNKNLTLRSLHIDRENINWYAVHVRSRHEFKVYEHLDRTGIEAFLPLVERLQRWKDRKKLVEFPLFPGYLFVHIQMVYDTILSVLKTPGVVRVLGHSATELYPVPEEQIVSLKKLVESRQTIDPYPYLKEGRRIRIKSGPFKGIEGILVKKHDKHTLVLSIDILQQGAAVRISASDVETI